MDRSEIKPKTKSRKSTILLISIVLMLLTLYASYIIVVNQKLDSKDYTYVNNEKSKYSRVKFDNQKVVVIKGLQNCIIVTSDTIKLDVFNEDLKSFESKLKEDTVTIVFNQPTSNKTFLYLPTGSQLIADSSSFEIKGSFDPRRAPKHKVTLRHSSLLATAHNSHTFFDKLTVTDLGNSQFEIAKYVHINELELMNVHNASFAQGWQIGNLKTLFNDGAEIEFGKYRDSVSINDSLPKR
ncbi:MAG TPA: hypothetical protein VK589_10650 [Chryseolinea sp.]|nr:hypothetical protein [Chryseolinea sp.]